MHIGTTIRATRKGSPTPTAMPIMAPIPNELLPPPLVLSLLPPEFGGVVLGGGVFGGVTDGGVVLSMGGVVGVVGVPPLLSEGVLGGVGGAV